MDSCVHTHCHKQARSLSHTCKHKPQSMLTDARTNACTCTCLRARTLAASFALDTIFFQIRKRISETSAYVWVSCLSLREAMGSKDPSLVMSHVQAAHTFILQAINGRKMPMHTAELWQHLITDSVSTCLNTYDRADSKVEDTFIA